MSAVGEAIAGRLAGAVFNAAAPRLKRQVLGSDEERALRKAFHAAFAASLVEILIEKESVSPELVEPQLEQFFGDPQVSAAIAEVALSRRRPEVDSLVGQLWTLGLDPTTFPIDVGGFINSLTMHLTEELRKHAARHDSPLFNEVALAELDTIRQQLEHLETSSGDGDHTPAPGRAPPLPGLILGREKALRDIKDRLGLSRERSEPGRTQVITAVRGWPGVGKTTLVSAVAHDPEVIAAFPDGVLWAALTHSERVATELVAWARALGLAPPTATASTIELSGALRAALRDKRTLLLLDDVWAIADAEPFRVGGRGCAMLVTTRSPEVAAALAPTAGDVYRLDILDDESALELLERLAPTVVAEHPHASHELVHELEGLPLALQVAGHQLQSQASMGLGVEELLQELRDGARLLAAAAPADRIDLIEQTTPTVAALLAQSTDRLGEEDRDRFALLGAFAPKPATFSVDALESVWEASDPVPTITTLVQRGLLEPIGGRRFQLHALLVAHARSLLEE
jgi:hypothetical protein